ncbi:MAG: helix-turn-helix transcriptional regulator [Lentisphaerae bacterium]|nr:helix-turn-helix transcriptional regulator [Lentisphaerota bacterium]
MPNVAQVLKAETLRLARKEARAATAKLRKDNAALKRNTADLKRRLAALEKSSRQLASLVRDRRSETLAPSREEMDKARVTSRMIRALRKRLKLTQVDFARLVKVTPLTVWTWETKDGRIRLRTVSKAAVLEARKMKAHEARERLDGIKQAEVARAGKKKTKRRKR